MVNNPTYFALLDACQQPGCPVCRISLNTVVRYLDNLFYENVNDWGMRRHLRGSLGFCREHAWQVIEGGLGNGLGVAIIYHDVLNKVLERLPDPEREQTKLERLSDFLGRLPRQLLDRINLILENLTPEQPCPACQHLEQTETRTVQVLLENLEDERLRESFKNSQGLCLPHLRVALKQARDEAGLEMLLALQNDKLNGLKQDLAEYIRKNDYRFAGEGFGSEGDSWRRAIARFVGEKNIKPPENG